MPVYTFTTLASFNGTNGSFPSADLIVDAAGNLYGTTYNGGPLSYGTVFEVLRSTGALLTLSSFQGLGESNPIGGVVADSAGNLYGVTTRGGGFMGDPNAGGYVIRSVVFEVVKSTGQTVQLDTPDRRFFAGLPTAGLVADSAGNLYGVTGAGNILNSADAGTTTDRLAGGTVFELVHGSGTARTLFTFPLDGSNGFDPEAGLTLDSNGDLYGTTSSGGASNHGTIFKISTSSGALQTLASFTGSNGDYPTGRLVLDSAGNLYGTTAQGGASGLGTVFEIVKSTGVLQTLVSFNGTNGAGPDAGLTLDAAGNLFGTTSGGGAVGQGTVFEIVGGIVQTIFTFNGSNGSAPSGGLILDSGGAIYGATVFGGPSNDGTVFKLTLTANSAPTLAGTVSNQQDVAGVGISAFSTVTVTDPDAGQTETVTVTYAAANGTLAGGGFVQTAPGVYTVAATSAAAAQADLRALTFTPVAGQNATTTFTLSVSDGQATATSGASVVAIASSTYTLTTLASFNASNGGAPAGSLVADGAGNLYGVTSGNGTSNQGTVFEIVKSTGALLTLASFTGANGSYPAGSLISDAAGNIYGTTSFGGASGQGNVFEIVKSTGLLLTLASFNGSNGARPDAGLIADAAGNLYGTTELGGASNLGTVFEIAGGVGPVLTLASFSGVNGSRPFAGLVADGAGNLYGTTAYGGASGQGTVFEIVKSSGALQTLVSFTGTNGGNPQASLIVDSAGNLYGTTYGGGASGLGTVFEIVRSTGALQTLASFNGSNGARPGAGLTIDAAGDLFGTTNTGPAGLAVVFEIVKSTGALQTLQTLQTLATGSNQVGAASGLIFDGAGVLYGTTVTGGAPGGQGTVFALSPPASQASAGVIGGVNGGQAASDTTPVQPFAQITVAGTDATQETVTVTYTAANGTLSGGGFVGSAGSYSASFASAAAAQAGLRALVFAPTANQAPPGSTVSTGFTVVVSNGATNATDTATTVVTTSVNDPPTLGGVAAAQTVTAGASVTPFASAVISDVDVGQTETVTVRYLAAAGIFAGAGFVSGPNGASGTFASAAAAQAALRAATFTPNAGVAATDTLTLSVLDAPGGGSAATVSTTLTVRTLAVANTPPTISGTVANQADGAGVGIGPFAAVVVSDPDAGQTETVTVSFAAAGGSFAGAGFTGANGSYTGAFASAAAAQAALRAAVFTPTGGQSGTTALTLAVSDGQATATDATTSVVASYTPAPVVTANVPASVQYGLAVEFQNLSRALLTGADAQAVGGPLYAQAQGFRAIAAQLDGGQLTLAQAETAMAHLVDGTTSVAVASYAFFTGATPTAAGLNYLVHSAANATDLNDPYYQRFSTENRYINFAVNLATGAGAGASGFAASYGSLSLRDATAKAYGALFGAPADAAKLDALLNALVPDGLGGTETRAAYFAQYGGDGVNGQGTKTAMVGWLLAQSVETGAGVYGTADLHYLSALAHGTAPAFGSELALTYGRDVGLVGTNPTADPTVIG